MEILHNRSIVVAAYVGQPAITIERFFYGL